MLQRYELHLRRDEQGDTYSVQPDNVGPWVSYNDLMGALEPIIDVLIRNGLPATAERLWELTAEPGERYGVGPERV